jgi:hypothetical protein
MGKVLRFGGARGRQEDVDENWMFDGLEGLAIVIEDLDAGAMEAGLNRTNIQFHIEGRLAEIGIPVAPLIAAAEDEAIAVLCVAIGAEQHPAGPFACFLSLQVCDLATLARNPAQGGGVITWLANDFWASSLEDVQGDTMEALDEGLANLGKSFLVGRDA